MYRIYVMLLVAIILGGSASSQSNLWITAYYPGYTAGVLPADSIDFTAITHLVHFSIFPDTAGGVVALDSNSNGVYETRSVVAIAQKYGTKVLLSVGGWDSVHGGGPFRFATEPARLSGFANAIINYANRYGYDGVDVDWEPLLDPDSAQFSALITNLRMQLGPNRILTVALGNLGYNTKIMGALAQLQSKLDQINIETSNLSGPYQGWFTWHNGPLYDAGAMFPVGVPPPSAHGMVTELFNAGVALGKLSIGIDFYGCVWYGGKDSLTLAGPTEPRRLWKEGFPPNVTFDYPYYKIMDSISRSPHATLIWDVDPVTHRETKAPYYSIVNPIAAKDSFVSFDDQRSCVAKIEYARNPGIDGVSGLGGIMVWDLSGGYRSSITGVGKFPDSLLQSIKAEAFGNYLYKYKLQRPWVNVSRTATVAFDDVTQHKLGWQSIKFSKAVSGGYFAMQYGASSTTILNPNEFSKLEFSWYCSAVQPVTTLSVYLALNGTKGGFTAVTIPSLPSGTWDLVSLKMSKLNPGKLSSFNQLVIKDGKSSIVYWLDDIHFFKGDTINSIQDSVDLGWNLVSAPNRSDDYSAQTLFPTRIEGSTFEFNTTYIARDSLAPGKGYWTKFPAPAIHAMTGTVLSSITVRINSGWNIIGTVDHVVPAPFGGTIVSNVYGYSKGYGVTTTLIPGNGYWVKASGPDVITLGEAFSPKTQPLSNDLTKLNSIHVTDAALNQQVLYFGGNPNSDSVLYELPPAAPEGMFDARFGTNSMVEFSDVKTLKTVSINIISAVYPVTISWEVRSINKGQDTLSFGSRHIALSGSGSSMIAAAGTPVILHLSPAGLAQLPSRFALEQSYPNPFNPTTTIRYSIPMDGRVTLTVFNILGQQVFRLVDADQKAGEYTVPFDGSNLSSGVYFYRLQTGDKADAKKFVLMK